MLVLLFINVLQDMLQLLVNNPHETTSIFLFLVKASTCCDVKLCEFS
jgi:hypothetical protein